MSRQLNAGSRTSTMDSTISAPSLAQASSSRLQNPNSSQTNLSRSMTLDTVNGAANTPASEHPNGPLSASSQTASLVQHSNSGLSGLVCNVHRTTGREPRPLVGASTTVVGDKLYVFGGRRLSRTRPQLTSDLYELDLLQRHWTKIVTSGDIPPPRYFHSVCTLGDTKLVCYGGMSPAVLPNGQPTIPDQPLNPQDPQPEVVVMSDIHIYDIPSQKWLKVQAIDSPQGRYAHCATVLPSSSLFTSLDAPKSAIHHNASSPSATNSGQLGITLDGAGGAEMVVVGGQDSANHYIEQISVFNLRSLRWTSTTKLDRSCGAYRSVTAPISSTLTAQIGTGSGREPESDEETAKDVAPEGPSSMLIYSNYNFLDVKLELQIRLPDGSLVEKPMQGTISPPGLRFPNGGVIDNHFVVSGTFLTSSKQEYALWALDLKSLVWFRVEAGGNTFTQGSWNRGILWNRRNTFVILGNRKRSLVEDYNHRRINFSNICMVELEAFGLYDNPRRAAPNSAFVSASSPHSLTKSEVVTIARPLTKAAEELGQIALSLPELSDMDFLAMNGERIPANSRLIARKWGPYFNHVMREALVSADANADQVTLRAGISSLPIRSSSATITPSLSSGYSNASTLRNSVATTSTITTTGTARPGTASGEAPAPSGVVASATPQQAALPLDSTALPSTRPRIIYLPHTPQTIRALLHFLYTSSLPAPLSSLATPQVLCSLLQLARPYRIDGLLEAVVERLHKVLDNRNTAAIFNAAAMAAGGGEGVRFFNPALQTADGDKGADARTIRGGTNGISNAGSDVPTADSDTEPTSTRPSGDLANSEARGRLRINTDISGDSAGRPSTSMSHSSATSDDDEALSASAESSLSGDFAAATSRALGLTRSPSGRDASTAAGTSTGQSREMAEVWTGTSSAVVGLQKRGLRGLMEGRRIREAVREGPVTGGTGVNGTGVPGDGRVGLGIADS